MTRVDVVWRVGGDEASLFAREGEVELVAKAAARMGVSADIHDVETGRYAGFVDSAGVVTFVGDPPLRSV